MEKRKKLLSVTIIFLVMLFVPSVVFADFGPKDRVTVKVKNYPDELYYLDMLQDEDGEYDNIDPTEYDPQMLEYLREYEDEGWYPALYGGTHIPLFGELTGRVEGDSMIHVFSYFGVPQDFRIIIVNSKGVVQVSDVIHRKTLQSSVEIDYFTGEVTVPPVWVSYVLQYISTFLATVIIEGIILIIMGFSIRTNGILFVLTNAFTQVILTAVAGHSVIIGGPTMGFLRFFPVEMAILVIETIIYMKLLKGREEKPVTNTKGRKIAYAVVANLLSWGVSLMYANAQFQWLMSFL